MIHQLISILRHLIYLLDTRPESTVILMIVISGIQKDCIKQARNTDVLSLQITIDDLKPTMCKLKTVDQCSWKAVGILLYLLNACFLIGSLICI